MAMITLRIDTEDSVTLKDIHETARAFSAKRIEVDGKIKYSNNEWEDEDHFIKCCKEDKIVATINNESLDDIIERRDREDEEAKEEYRSRLSAKVRGKLSY